MEFTKIEDGIPEEYTPAEVICTSGTRCIAFHEYSGEFHPYIIDGGENGNPLSVVDYSWIKKYGKGLPVKKWRVWV